jgi:hypothetical protein
MTTTDALVVEVTRLRAAINDIAGAFGCDAEVDDLDALTLSMIGHAGALGMFQEHGHTDTRRLDWWERHIHEGPCVGFYTDGVLGLGRGHVVDTRWTVKGQGYPTLRAAIDAAMSSPTTQHARADR